MSCGRTRYLGDVDHVALGLEGGVLLGHGDLLLEHLALDGCGGRDSTVSNWGSTVSHRVATEGNRGGTVADRGVSGGESSGCGGHVSALF